MTRILILFFTLNALLLPVSGYAGMLVSGEMEIPMSKTNVVSPATSNHDDLKCHMMVVEEGCPNCDMDVDCDAACCEQCLSHSASLPMFFGNKTLLPTNGESITTLFKHFYFHITSPEQRPPLV